MKLAVQLGALACLWALGACSPMPIPTLSVATATSAATPTRRGAATPPTVVRPIPTTVPTEADLLPLPTGTPVSYIHNPRAVLIEADLWNDSTAGSWDAHVPIWRLYGDGLVVFAGSPAVQSSGLDAAVRVGHLSESQIFSLLTFLGQVGVYSLDESYRAQPAPADAPTAHIGVFVSRTKTVSVYAPDSETTPRGFSQAWARITETVPDDAAPFVPTDAYLESTDVGAVSNFGSSVNIGSWSVGGIALADAIEGVTVEGRLYSQVAVLIAQQNGSLLFREGNRVYRVRFAPNLPRAYHPTDWIGPILAAPREFDGRVFQVTGYFRGGNLYGEARGSPPDPHGDWVIADQNGAIYVDGPLPAGLDPASRADAWSVIRLTARVVYVRLGTSYLEARRVQVLQSSASPSTPTLAATAVSPAMPAVTMTTAATVTRGSTPVVASTPPFTMTGVDQVPGTTSPIASADAAIGAVKSRFPEVAQANRAAPGTIGATTDVTVLNQTDGWNLVFWQGWGDCPSGCINNHYYYFSVRKDGSISRIGEYVRVFNAETNSFDVTGAPRWGVPRN